MKESKSGILAVSKRTLLLVAGLVWGIAGFRVFTLGEGDVSSYNGSVIISTAISFIIFFIFFNFIFKKMSVKHTKRIVNSKLRKQCVFSFFDVKGYIIMGCMMTFGIIVRSSGIFNPFYIGIINFIKFEDTKIKYTV